MVCPPAAAIANMVQGIGKQWCGKTDSLAIDENWAPFTGGITLRDPNGVYELDLSAKTRSINVKSPFGNVNISAFTGITIDAPNGDINIRGKNVNIEAGNNLTLTSGTNIRNKDFSYKELGLSASWLKIRRYFRKYSCNNKCSVDSRNCHRGGSSMDKGDCKVGGCVIFALLVGSDCAPSGGFAETTIEAQHHNYSRQ